MKYKHAVAHVPADAPLQDVCDQMNGQGWEVVSVLPGQQVPVNAIEVPGLAKPGPIGIFIILLRMPFNAFQSMVARKRQQELRAQKEAERGQPLVAGGIEVK
jgi:hypothetical protein